MKSIIDHAAWQALKHHQLEMVPVQMKELFAANLERFNEFSLTLDDITIDYSKNRISHITMNLLRDLARAANLQQNIAAMFSGKIINHTENRAALHTALRNMTNRPIQIGEKNIMDEVNTQAKKMADFIQKFPQENSKITDIVNIGIGGSETGPRLLIEALAPYKKNNLNFHFISNLDGFALEDVLKKIKPHNTLFFISSKSFTTQETLTNAMIIRDWFKQTTQETDTWQKNFYAITACPPKAETFGIQPENIFSFSEGVGGRYSVWSSIGLPAALSIGLENFQSLLAGAHAMDEHFQKTAFEKNIPVILALIDIWYINFFESHAQAIIPYSQRLQLLPTYLQQLLMESNGKSIQNDDEKILYSTSPVIFGGVGTNSQHSFFQLLHQGTNFIPIDFILPLDAPPAYSQQQSMLFANAISQSKVLMEGKSANTITEELSDNANLETKNLIPHRVLNGNHPSNTIILNQLNPYNLGSLIALYEHRTFVQSVIWQINAFDQWGVEEGKKMTDKILPALTKDNSQTNFDCSTNGLIDIYRRKKTPN